MRPASTKPRANLSVTGPRYGARRGLATGPVSGRTPAVGRNRHRPPGDVTVANGL